VLTLGRAVERHPDAPVVYTALGKLWLTTAEREQDRAALRKAIAALRPANDLPGAGSDTRTLYGRALALSGSLTLAERVLQQAVTTLPVDPLAYRYLAEVSLRLGHGSIARDATAKYAALASGG